MRDEFEGLEFDDLAFVDAPHALEAILAAVEGSATIHFGARVYEPALYPASDARPVDASLDLVLALLRSAYGTVRLHAANQSVESDPHEDEAMRLMEEAGLDGADPAILDGASLLATAVARVLSDCRILRDHAAARP